MRVYCSCLDCVSVLCCVWKFQLECWRWMIPRVGLQFECSICCCMWSKFCLVIVSVIWKISLMCSCGMLSICSSICNVVHRLVMSNVALCGMCLFLILFTRSILFLTDVEFISVILFHMILSMWQWRTSRRNQSARQLL